MPYRDLERRRAYGRDWIRRNAEKAREAMRRWRAHHHDEHNAEVRAYYAKYRDARLAVSAKYHREHPEVSQAAWERRRARKLQADGAYTSVEWRDLIAAHGGRCAYCGLAAPLHADHRTPLSRGGTNWIDNILPACARCNQRKHTLTEVEFRARLARERVLPNR